MGFEVSLICVSISIIVGLNPFCFGVWGLSRQQLKVYINHKCRLNPFCFGVWGLRGGIVFQAIGFKMSLNPFCFGVWGLRIYMKTTDVFKIVRS